MIVVLLFTRRYTLCSDVYVFLVMSMHFLCRLLQVFLMSVSCVLLINGAAILLCVCTWSIFFSTIIRRSDVELTGSWRLDFRNVSFGTSVRHSDVEPLSYLQLDFRHPGWWLMLGIVSLSPWWIRTLVHADKSTSMADQIQYSSGCNLHWVLGVEISF